MPAIQRTPPDPGSYSYVLRRYDLACVNSQCWSTYAETTQSRAITLGGVEAQTLFLREQAGAQRARRLGWQDVTEEWMNHLEESTPRPTTEPQRKILSALDSMAEEWHAKKEIVTAAQIADSEWRTAIAYLERLGLVQCNKRKGSTNRSFRYRLTDDGRTAVGV
jgi:hypothetical protein